MPRKILLIKHNDAPNDDRTATHLAARGFDLEWRRPFAGEPLPADVDGLAGLIVQAARSRCRRPTATPSCATRCASWAAA